MPAMSTTSLSPNMWYVPLSLVLQSILLVLVNRNSDNKLTSAGGNTCYTLPVQHNLFHKQQHALLTTLKVCIISFDQFKQHGGTAEQMPPQFPTFARYEF